MRRQRTTLMTACRLLIFLLLATPVLAQESPRTQAEAWVENGLAIGDNSDVEAKCYRKAIEFDPTYAAAHFNLAFVLHKQEKFAEALSEYRLCLRYHPDRPAALLNAGNLVLLAERDAEEGRKYLSRYLELLERDPGAEKKELAQLRTTVQELEKQIAEQKGCVFQEFYTAEEIIEILARRITRPRGGGKLYGVGHVPVMLFEVGMDTLSPDAKRQLDEVAKALHDSRLAEITIVIEGYADSTGDSKKNLQLSARRAIAVATYLVDRWHVPWDKLIVRWYGEDKPVAENATRDGRRKNRRIEVNNAAACW